MTTGSPGRGRLVLVTGVDPELANAAGRALAGRLDRALAVPVGALAAMVVSGGPATGSPTTEGVRQLFLAWSASLAVAETYQLEGFDVVVSDSVLGDRLEDFLELVDPEPLHLVVLGSVRSAGADPSPPIRLLRATPRRGLWLDPAERSPDDLADVVLARLGESLVTED